MSRLDSDPAELCEAVALVWIATVGVVDQSGGTLELPDSAEQLGMLDHAARCGTVQVVILLREFERLGQCPRVSAYPGQGNEAVA